MAVHRAALGGGPINVLSTGGIANPPLLLKTPTAIDRRPSFPGFWTAVSGNVWGRKRDGIQLGSEREKSVQHSS